MQTTAEGQGKHAGPEWDYREGVQSASKSGHDPWYLSDSHTAGSANVYTCLSFRDRASANVPPASESTPVLINYRYVATVISTTYQYQINILIPAQVMVRDVDPASEIQLLISHLKVPTIDILGEPVEVIGYRVIKGRKARRPPKAAEQPQTSAPPRTTHTELEPEVTTVTHAPSGSDRRSEAALVDNVGAESWQIRPGPDGSAIYTAKAIERSPGRRSGEWVPLLQLGDPGALICSAFNDPDFHGYSYLQWDLMIYGQLRWSSKVTQLFHLGGSRLRELTALIFIQNLLGFSPLASVNPRLQVNRNAEEASFPNQTSLLLGGLPLPPNPKQVSPIHDPNSTDC